VCVCMYVCLCVAHTCVSTHIRTHVYMSDVLTDVHVQIPWKVLGVGARTAAHDVALGGKNVPTPHCSAVVQYTVCIRYAKNWLCLRCISLYMFFMWAKMTFLSNVNLVCAYTRKQCMQKDGFGKLNFESGTHGCVPLSTHCIKIFHILHGTWRQFWWANKCRGHTSKNTHRVMHVV